jgi:hypothetical protein
MIRTSNSNHLTTMGAVIPVSRSECDNHIPVLQSRSARTRPHSRSLDSKAWFSEMRDKELGGHTEAVKGLASSSAGATSDAEDLTDLKV